MRESLYIIHSHKHPFERIINLTLQMRKQTQNDEVLCLNHRSCMWSILDLNPGLPNSKASFSLYTIDYRSSSCLHLYDKIILFISLSPDPSM